MDLDHLRRNCLSKPGAVAGHPFGPAVLVIKVGGKIFAIIAEEADPLEVSLKCEPEIALVLRDAYDAVRPGYHLNKRHWNTVTLDGSVKDVQLRDWIDDSYDLVLHGLSAKARSSLLNGD